MTKSPSDLKIFNLACSFAANIFQISRNFPKEEKYSLTGQIVRASISIAANIAEGWAKRVYDNEFKKHLIYSMGSLEESNARLLFAKDCGYISIESFNTLFLKCDQPGSKIYRLYENWKTL